jgi:hypothetical protein
MLAATANGRELELGGDTKAVLLAAGLMFIVALLLGIWKHRQMVTSENGLAHPYVDTAHRAALLYSFAILLIATFVQFSGWSETVDSIAAFTFIFFSLAALSGYIEHGLKKDTVNQFHPQPRWLGNFMTLLIVAEIASVSVLVAGFVDAQIL